MNKTTFINFRTIDFTGVDTLSTYCIDLTPLKFIPEIPQGFPHRLVWDFGDGTTSKSVSASKIYNFPGVYTVSLIVYDCDTNANISTYTKNIIVENYVNFTFNIKFDIENPIYLLAEDGDYLLTEDGDYIAIDYNQIYLLAEDGYYLLTEDGDYIAIDYNYNQIHLKCGKISKPFTITSYYPIYQPPVPIFYTIDGSNSKNYWDIQNNKFSHLENYHTLYVKKYNYAIKQYQYHPIDKIQFSPTEIYAKIDNNTIKQCTVNEIGATLVGYKDSGIIYIKDDSISDECNIHFKFDNNVIVVNPTTLKEISYLNNLGIDLKYSTIVNDDVDHLSITSNGLDGEGVSISSFNISPTKFFNTKIPFIIKIKDSELYSVKNFNQLQLSSLNININGAYVSTTYPIWYNGDDVVYNDETFQYTTTISNILSTHYNIYSLNDTLSEQNAGGSFRGYIEFPLLSSDTLKDVTIATTYTFIDDQLSLPVLSGISTPFNVYKKDFYNIFKKNENFDPTETLKNLRFQETLLDKTVLFDDFFGGLLGTNISDHEGIGIKTYEKIANFAVNTQDIDYCELEFLDSLGEFVGYNNVGEERYTYPEKIKRLVNLGSIDKFKLTGISNKFAQNLDIKGRTSKTEYGINIGDEIDPDTYIVNPFIPIVALEKFSNVYSVINTFQPGNLDETVIILDTNGNILTDQYGNYITTTNIISLSTYPLSTYNYDWGWPLVLPNDFQFSDMSKYYLFFDYVAQYDNTIIGGIIDFENPRTTVDYIDVSTDIFQHMFMDTIYQTLSLIN